MVDCKPGRIRRRRIQALSLRLRKGDFSVAKDYDAGIDRNSTRSRSRGRL